MGAFETAGDGDAAGVGHELGEFGGEGVVEADVTPPDGMEVSADEFA